MQTPALVVMIIAATSSLIAATAGDAFHGRVRREGKVKPSIWIAGATALIAIAAGVADRRRPGTAQRPRDANVATIYSSQGHSSPKASNTRRWPSAEPHTSRSTQPLLARDATNPKFPTFTKW